MKYWSLALLCLLAVACAPLQSVELREIKNVQIKALDGRTMLMADAVLFNPNKSSLTLRQADVDILLNEKKVGQVNQSMKLQVKAQSEFVVPLEVQVSLKDVGLLDTFLSLLGGRKYDVHFKGAMKVRIHGIGVSVPVDHHEQIKF